MKRLSFGKNGSEKSSDLDGLKHLWFDYQPNSLALPIFSERFKNLIDAHAMDKEYLDWIEVKIHQNKKVFRTYYMLKFKQKKDVLNLEKSEFSGRNADFLVKPFFALEKIDNLNIFTIAEDNWQITSHLYVSQEIKAAAKAQSMIGLNFEDVNASRFI
ncbi:MAG: imm11 family protein [Janthinobacterium lividum]